MNIKAAYRWYRWPIVFGGFYQYCTHGYLMEHKHKDPLIVYAI